MIIFLYVNNQSNKGKPTMMKYYQETESGDFLSVDTSTKSYYDSIGQPGMLEGRSTCLAGNRLSVNTTKIDIDYLKETCKPVAKKNVPKEWLNVL